MLDPLSELIRRGRLYKLKNPEQSPSHFLLDSPLLRRLFLIGGALLLGQWVLNDFIHFPGGGIGFLAAGIGVWWLSRPVISRFDAPISVNGWVRRLRNILKEFDEFEEEAKSLGISYKRINSLEEIIQRSGPQSICFVSTSGINSQEKVILNSAIQVVDQVNISFGETLAQNDQAWVWPKQIKQKDLILYFLKLPLQAVDLLWLKQIPEEQPAWIVVDWTTPSSWDEQLSALIAQLPDRWEDRLLRLTNQEDGVIESLEPIRRLLESPTQNINRTRQRLLSDLHCNWQADLEKLRRHRFHGVQQRTQWLVAGAVFASPVASTDLLAMAVVNGLMVQEMGQIWKCSWKPETLQAVAKSLASVAVAQGVVEWSGQALLSVAKLDGSSWLAAGALQAVSAAYLTRVVGSSMADLLALNNGVSEPDLEVLKLQAPALVEKAAEKERLDWSGFLNQARTWLSDSHIYQPKKHSSLEAL